MDTKALGQRIKEERLKQSLTQEQLAEKVGISRLYITLIENGSRAVRVEVLERLADCLKVSIDYLVKGSGQFIHKEAVHEFEQLISGINSEEEISDIMDIIKAIIVRFSKQQ